MSSMTYSTSDALPGIRKMADLAAQNAIDKALATLPKDKHGAVVFYATGEEVRAGVFGKLGNHWTYSGTLARSWKKGTISGEAEVRFLW